MTSKEERSGRSIISIEDSARVGPSSEIRLGIRPSTTPALAMLALIISSVLSNIQAAWRELVRRGGSSPIPGCLYFSSVLLHVVIDTFRKCGAYSKNQALNFSSGEKIDEEVVALNKDVRKVNIKINFNIFIIIVVIIIIVLKYESFLTR